MTYDLIVVGGGPGGAAAGVYAARKRLKTLLITDTFGGQSTVSADIQNWIGIPSFSGYEMSEKLEEHLRKYAEDILTLQVGERVTKIEKVNSHFKVTTDKGNVLESLAIILTSGSRRRKLAVPGAAEYDGKGIVYCATCDAPLFRGKEVVVIGGGNAGLESAEQLLEYATKIYILEFGAEFKGDPVTRERVFKNAKVMPITNAATVTVRGDKFVTGLVYKDRHTDEQKELLVQGIFVEIGSVPNSEMVKGLVELDKHGEVIIDHKTARTSMEGIWAAGDVSDQPYKQNNISMGDSVKALEDAYMWLQTKKDKK